MEAEYKKLFDDDKFVEAEVIQVDQTSSKSNQFDLSPEPIFSLFSSLGFVY
jgi:hypothetical protein